MDIDQIFGQALNHHRAGRLPEAENLYRRVLDASTAHAEALYYLGRIVSEQGNRSEAAELLERSLAVSPDHPERANNLGAVYQALGDADKAVQWFEMAIDGDDGQAEAHLNLATIRHARGKLADAEAGYRRAIAIKPNFAIAHSNLSSLLRLQGRHDEAIAAAARAVEIDADSAKAHNNLGVALHEQNHLMAAFQSFKRAVEIDPEYAEAYNNMGSVFRDENHTDGAIASYRKAIALDPNLADAHNNLGSVLQRQGDWEGARGCFATALALNPEFPPALANMGTIDHRRNNQSEALTNFRKALVVDPEFAEAHFNISEVLLMTEPDMREGWEEHRWRWRKREFRLQWRDFGVPVWDGSDPAGKRIALWGEQGVGEEIMYAGMVPDLLDAGADVVVECEPRLVPLFQRSFPSVVCIARTVDPPEPVEALDFHIPAGDLGLWYRPRADSFPKRPSYLLTDPSLRDILRSRYQDGSETPIIGLSWYSNNPEIGWEKSVGLDDWRALLETEQVRFVDLQYGDNAVKRDALQAETGIEIIHDEEIDQLKDLDAFSAQVAAMDLVVSISNTTVHMAGALGVPTWVLLSEVPLWRWFQGREDSPWYPSVRLIRQRQAGRWDEILGETATALKQWVSGI